MERLFIVHFEFSFSYIFTFHLFVNKNPRKSDKKTIIPIGIFHYICGNFGGPSLHHFTNIKISIQIA